MPAELNQEREQEAPVEQLSEAELREAYNRATGGAATPKDEDDEGSEEAPEADPAVDRRAHRAKARKKAEDEAKKKTTPKADDQDADEEDPESDDDDLDEDDDDEELEDDDDEDSDEDDDEDESKDALLTKAYKTLKLDGYSVEDIAELRRTFSKERIIALAEKIAKRQADVAKKLQRKAESTKANSDEAGSPPEAEDGDSAATSKGLRVNPKRLKEVFDDTAAEAIGSTVEELATTYGRQIEETNQHFQNRLDELAMENLRLRLSLRRPDDAALLSDDRNWSRVLKRMSALKELGEHTSADDLADEAIAAVSKGRAKKQQSLRGQDLQPRAPGTRRRSESTREPTELEIERQAYDISTDRTLSPSARRRRLDRIARRSMS